MAQFTDRLSDRKSAKQLGAKGDTDDGSDILKFETLPGALGEIGHDGDGFAFDCEGPRHNSFIEPFRLADRLVTNKEWMEFIVDGGYRSPLLWLSEGRAKVQFESWTTTLLGRAGRRILDDDFARCATG